MHIGTRVIDSNYRGEVKILVFNLTFEVIHFKAGEAITQIIFTKITTPKMMWVPTLSNTIRGPKGFESTSDQPSTSYDKLWDPLQ